MWTEKRQPFLVINAHCITDSHQHDTFCLAFQRVPESHTAANLLQRVTAVVESFIDVPNRSKIVSLTTDTTSNVKRLGHDSPWMWVPCIAHVLNLTVHDAIDKPILAELISRARALATAFRNVQQLSMGLEHRQRQIDAPVQPLILDVVTRWNSLYLMLTRIIEQRQNVQVVLLTTNNTDKDLPAADWDLIREVLGVLEPFFLATNIISGERYCNISLICPPSSLFARQSAHQPATTHTSLFLMLHCAQPSQIVSSLTSHPKLSSAKPVRSTLASRTTPSTRLWTLSMAPGMCGSIS